MHNLLHWLSIWWSYFTSRAGHLLSRTWLLLASYSVLILVFRAVFLILASSHGKVLPPDLSEELDEMITIVLLMIAYSITFLAFVVLFILSVFPQTRGIADKFFRFSKPIEKRVEKIEVELPSINKRLENIAGRLANTESRLGNIEATLKRGAKSTSHTNRPTQKSKQGRTKQALK